MIKKIEEMTGIKPFHHVGGFFSRLLTFLKEYSVIGVALGVIVAQAAKDFVDNMVKGVFIPLFNLLIPGNEIAAWNFRIRGVRFDFGAPLISFVTLLIIVIFLYLIFKRIINHSLLEEEKKEE